MDYYGKITYYIMCISYLYEVAHDVCYKGLIGNNLFVSVITNKGKIIYIRPPKPNLMWETLNDIGIMKCFCCLYLFCQLMLAFRRLTM